MYKSASTLLKDVPFLAHLAVTVRMAMGVSTSAASVRVTVVTARCDHADQIDGESNGTDGQELPGVHLRRVHEALDRFKDDKDRNKAQEDSVRKAGECLNTGVAVRLTTSESEGHDAALRIVLNVVRSPVSVYVIAGPGRHDAGEEAHSEREAVEEHVDRCGWWCV